MMYYFALVLVQKCWTFLDDNGDVSDCYTYQVGHCVHLVAAAAIRICSLFVLFSYISGTA